MRTAPTPKQLMVALSMIDVERWRTPMRIVTAVASMTLVDVYVPIDSLVELGQRDVYRWFAGDRQARHVWVTMNRLADQQVLIRDAGGGSRKSAWGLDGDIARWEGVPWVFPRHVVVERVAAALFVPPAASPDAHSYARHVASPANLATRAMSRRQEQLATRAGARRHRAVSDATWRASPARADAPASSLLVEFELQEEEKGFAAELRDAISAAGGGPVVGRLHQRLVAVVAQANGNAEQLLKAVRATTGLRPPGLIKMLEELLITGDLERRAAREKSRSSVATLAPLPALQANEVVREQIRATRKRLRPGTT